MGNGYRANLTSGGAAVTSEQWIGGQGQFIVSAVTGIPGTVALQVLAPDGNWVPVTGISLAAIGVQTFNLPPAPIRVVLTTFSAATAYAVRA